jgi:integrase
MALHQLDSFLGNPGRTRVAKFLLSTLGSMSQDRYANSLVEFHAYLGDAEVNWSTLSEADRDWVLAEYILEEYEAGHSRAKSAYLLSALGRIDPRSRMRTSWKVLDVWFTHEPSRQAPAIPTECVLAMVTFLAVIGREAEAMAALLCFSGLLRAREALNLQLADVIVSHDCVILILGKTKRGTEQKVVLSHPIVLTWLAAFSKWKLKHGAFRGLDSSRFIGVSYGRLLYWTRRAAESLGLGELSLTTHTYRRSGATALVLLGTPFEDVMLFGRWASNKSAREYIRRGENAVIKARASCLKHTWSRILMWTRHCKGIWELKAHLGTFSLQELTDTSINTLHNILAIARQD